MGKNGYTHTAELYPTLYMYPTLEYGWRPNVECKQHNIFHREGKMEDRGKKAYLQGQKLILVKKIGQIRLAFYRTVQKSWLNTV